MQYARIKPVYVHNIMSVRRLSCRSSVCLCASVCVWMILVFFSLRKPTDVLIALTFRRRQVVIVYAAWYVCGDGHRAGYSCRRYVTSMTLKYARPVFYITLRTNQYTIGYNDRVLICWGRRVMVKRIAATEPETSSPRYDVERDKTFCTFSRWNVFFFFWRSSCWILKIKTPVLSSLLHFKRCCTVVHKYTQRRHNRDLINQLLSNSTGHLFVFYFLNTSKWPDLVFYLSNLSYISYATRFYSLFSNAVTNKL